MSEREGPAWSGEGKAVAAEVSERIRSILADAEAAAAALRHEAQQDAQARRRGAETEALKIIEEARREAERFLAERIEQVSRLSDEILGRGQALVERLDQAEGVRSELAQLSIALGDTAARLANEVRALPGPQVPEIAPAPPGRERAEPEPPATAEPELRVSDLERGPTISPVPQPERAPEPEPERAPEPEPERAPEPEPERPVLEPTPLRPAPAPAPEPPPPAAEQEPQAEAEAAPTEEEATLIEQVRAGEQERAAEDSEPATSSDNGSPAQEARDTSATPDQALGARLVALQMAVAGGNRGEVEAHLRRAFDLTEPGPMLDDIFGAGTPSEQRVVWS